MTAKRASCLTSVALLGIMLVLYLWFKPNHDSPLYTETEFESSGFAKWVSLPSDAGGIFAEFFGGFDTNYRTVVFSHASTDPAEIIQQSINLNSQYSGDEILWLNNRAFSLEGLFSVFLYGESAIPVWWVQSFSKTKPVATIAFWERDGYGFGYLVVTEPLVERVRVLQFSQQHLTFDSLEDAFPEKTLERDVDLGG